MGDWRSDVVVAAREYLRIQGGPSAKGRWTRVGVAEPSGADGWLDVDLRDSKIKPDNLNQLCLAGDGGPDEGMVFPVVEQRFADGVLELKVGASVPADRRTVWTQSMSLRFLLECLQDGLARISQAPLAEALATRRLSGPAPRRGTPPPGLFPAQLSAYDACMAPGVRLVWGPPGAGKTRVLARAIEDLVGAGRRVLLVSTANVAVDNALYAVVNAMKPAPGMVVRVGTAQLAEIADNPAVQLDQLTAAAAREADEQRARVEAQLAGLNGLGDRVAPLEQALHGYDHDAYLVALKRVRRAERADLLRDDLRGADKERSRCAQEFSTAKANELTANAEWSRIAEQRELLARIPVLQREIAGLEKTLTRQEADLLTSGTKWWSGRRKAKKLTEAITVTRGRITECRRLIERCRADALPVTEVDVVRLARQIPAAGERSARAEAAARAADERAGQLSRDIAHLEALGLAADTDRVLVEVSDAGGLPAKREELMRLRIELRDVENTRGKLEAEQRQLVDRARRLRRDAEGEIIRDAKVVATTLARSRAHPALAQEQFEVVLVDEAGAAILAEVLLVLARARTTAVLFGDFLQLGPVIEQRVRNSDNEAVRSWIVSDCFTHVGIRTPQDAARDESCVVLQHQFRFGPTLRELANKVIYQVLRDADELPGIRANPNTEIVLVDVSGLKDLAEVRTADGRRGWWPAGLVLSRALAEHHLGEGPVGVVTPYALQRDATLAALRDKGIIHNVDVGTVHAFQGREFPTVVFDMVEDGTGWVAKAKRGGGDYEDNGVRLFGVAITRVQHRLYLIANYDVVRTAGRGPLAELRQLCASGRVEVWSAAALLGIAEHRASSSGAAFAEVREILQQLVSVTDISDELTFWQELDKHLRGARRRVWMWSPWIAKRADQVIPLIGEAVGRGVDVTVFIRPDDDQLMRKLWAQQRIPSLKATGATFIRADHEHRKIVVIDDETVLLGSLNTLSQSARTRTSEIMITMVGRAFATRLLDELHADELGTPRTCTSCASEKVIYREKDGRWYWKCQPCKSKDYLAVTAR